MSVKLRCSLVTQYLCPLFGQATPYLLGCKNWVFKKPLNPLSTSVINNIVQYLYSANFMSDYIYMLSYTILLTFGLVGSCCARKWIRFLVDLTIFAIFWWYLPTIVVSYHRLDHFWCTECFACGSKLEPSNDGEIWFHFSSKSL